MAITTTSAESTTPLAFNGVAQETSTMIGDGYATATSTTPGNFLITNAVTLYLNHAYVWIAATAALLKVDKTVDMSTYKSGIWTGAGSAVPLATSVLGTGTNTAVMEQPRVWMKNDQGYPVAAANVGQLAYLTTGEHVGCNHSDLNTACVAGKILKFDGRTGLVLVDFAVKAV
jgi:hypothetical protein